MNLFLCQNLKTYYNVVPYGDHGTERVIAITNPIGLDMAVFHIPDNQTTHNIQRCESLFQKIQGNKEDKYSTHNGEPTYNKKLCDALLQTLDQASTEMAENLKAEKAENPIPRAIRQGNANSIESVKATPTKDPPHTVTSNSQYDNISSAESTPKLDISEVYKPFYQVQAPNAEPNLPAQHNDATVTRQEIVPTQMFVKISAMDDTKTKYGPKTIMTGEIQTHDKSPRTWYHVDDGGKIITVTENGQTTGTAATPLLDERSPRYIPQPTTQTTCMEDARTHTTKHSGTMTDMVLTNIGSTMTETLTKHSGTMTDMVLTNIGSTMTETLTKNTGCDPMPTCPRKDQSTHTVSPKMVDCSCSPIKHDMVDMGTDPIPWWLINTRELIKNTNQE
jgi:hypothetical protein